MKKNPAFSDYFYSLSNDERISWTIRLCLFCSLRNLKNQCIAALRTYFLSCLGCKRIKDNVQVIFLSLIILLFLSATTSTFAQVFNEVGGVEIPFIQLKKINESINLDGDLTEQFWLDAMPAKNFTQFFPTDSTNALGPTEIRMAYDDRFLYVGFKCFTEGNDFIIPSLRRDYDFFGNDNITLLLDTYNDKTSALVFGINPYGVRREATVANGGQQGGNFDSSWDNKWDGNAKMHDTYWTAEMAIPFKTLRYTEGSKSWRFNVYRYDTQNNEISVWIRIPQNRSTIDLGFMGNMVWEEPLEKPKKNISIIPYLAASLDRDYENEEQTTIQQDYNIGGDAKLAVTSGLNLDLTFNPDFSQVEVDAQVTNLDRFEIQFPERRQFFLENADLFGSFASERINPFFSRRIGVSIDTATGQNIQNTILYGARLSGKINDRLRVGLLNMQTAKQTDNGLPGFNYTVATAEQQVFNRSGVAFMFVNKDAINRQDFAGDFNNYNRVLGLEYRLASANNKWIGKSSFLRSFSPDIESDDYAHFTQLVYIDRKYRFEWAHQIVGNGYNPEVGFAPRRDIALFSPEAAINFYPTKENSKISRHTIGFDATVFYKLGEDDNDIIQDFSIEEFRFNPFWEFRFTNSSNLVFYSVYTDLTLLEDFDPTRIQDEGIVLPAGSEHSFTNFGAEFVSDRRKVFNFRVEPFIGSFFNGFRAGVSGRFTYRYQPYGSVSLNYNFNHIRLDEPFETANLWLVGPRIDLTFTKNLFLTTFIQYNSQLDNLNLNARLQWRFKPVSDFFIVYTDNYLTNPFDQFGSRNRALVAKLTYWFNL